MREHFGSDWNTQQPEKPRKRGEKLKKPGGRKGVAYGLGTAALGLALAVGTIGEKKPGMPAVPVSKPAKAHPSPTPEQIRALRQAFKMQQAEHTEESTGIIEDVERSSAAMPTTTPQFLPNPAKNEILETTEGEPRILTEEEAQTLFFWGVADSNAPDILRNHLDALRGRQDAKDILATVNIHLRDSDDEKKLFDSLPKIDGLNLLSEQDLDSFIKSIVEIHPGTYLDKLLDPAMADYLPQDKMSILDALEKNPSVLIQAGLAEERGDPDLLTNSIRAAIEEGGDAELMRLYDLFTNPKHPDYAKYSAKEKTQIAALLPLMQNGSLSFDEAAERVQTDTIGYWQTLVYVAQAVGDIKGIGGQRILATQELERVARALINHGKPDDVFLKEVEDRFSAQEINSLIAHADPPTTPAERAIFDRLSETAQKKVEAEIDRRP